jgi:6-phosphogluconolactonase
MEELKEQYKTFDIVISGYGEAKEETVTGYRLDVTGKMRKLWKAGVEQASFVCHWQDYLFTVTETDDDCIVYLLKKSEEGYSLLDQKKLEGGALCHITYSSKHQILYGACYSTGTIFAVRLEEDHFGDVIYSEEQHSLSGKSLTRAHCVLLNANEDKLLTINIALDEVICYKLPEGVPVFSERLTLPEGVGPRHAIYSSDETFLYVITEYSNEIFVFLTEGYKLLQQVSTLPQQYQGISNCSTLCMTTDGRYLYAANRGADTIALFRVNSEGMLEWIKEYPCGGQHPRHMIITNQNELLIICNQFSHQVTAYTLDAITGELSHRVLEIPFNNPSGIVQV